MLEGLDRVLVNNNWLTLLFLAVFVLLAFIKLLFKERLKLLTMSFFSKNYLIAYTKEANTVFNMFHFLMFVFQSVVVSLLLFLVVEKFKLFTFQDKIWGYFQVWFSVIGFYGARFFLGLLISRLFDFGKEHLEITFLKSTYLSVVCFWVLPLLILDVYAFNSAGLSFKFILAITVMLLIVRGGLVFGNKKKLLLSNFFYFILYLCALETAPLLIIYKLII